MTEATRLDPEERIRAEVERAIAPYVGVATPAVLAKMRELAERYYREHPQASQILRALDRPSVERSGTVGEETEGAERDAVSDAKKKR